MIIKDNPSPELCAKTVTFRDHLKQMLCECNVTQRLCFTSHPILFSAGFSSIFFFFSSDHVWWIPMNSRVILVAHFLLFCLYAIRTQWIYNVNQSVILEKVKLNLVMVHDDWLILFYFFFTNDYAKWYTTSSMNFNESPPFTWYTLLLLGHHNPKRAISSRFIHHSGIWEGTFANKYQYFAQKVNKMVFRSIKNAGKSCWLNISTQTQG